MKWVKVANILEQAGLGGLKARSTEERREEMVTGERGGVALTGQDGSRQEPWDLAGMPQQ